MQPTLQSWGNLTQRCRGEDQFATMKLRFLIRRGRMSARYEPQLNHIGFDWNRDYGVIRGRLLDREKSILTKLGFYREYGTLDDPKFTGHVASMELLDELSGILAKCATIIMDAGWKAPHQIIATTNAVEKDPTVLLTRAVEPEALGSLGAAYQRADEPRGTFWFDITEGHLTGVPSLDQIREAATFAKARLKREASRGRRKKIGHAFLAAELGFIFLRFNEQISRHSVRTVRNGVDIQEDGGPFIEFLREVLASLNEFLRELPDYYGERGPISESYLARLFASTRGSSVKHIAWGASASG